MAGSPASATHNEGADVKNLAQYCTVPYMSLFVNDVFEFVLVFCFGFECRWPYTFTVYVGHYVKPL